MTPPYSLNLSSLDLYVLQLKCVLKGQQFSSTEEVTAKAMSALTDVLKTGFQESFQKLCEHWQKCVTVQGNYFEGNVV
jgi:hypothetical protein